MTLKCLAHLSSKVWRRHILYFNISNIVHLSHEMGIGDGIVISTQYLECVI